MDIKFKCCDGKSDFGKNISRVRDVDGESIGVYCTKHGKQQEDLLKEKRFVEDYKENTIYFKDGCFYPYWGCRYFYLTLDACKNRIDNKHIAIFPAI